MVGKRVWLGLLKAGHTDVQQDLGFGSSYLDVCMVKPPQFYPGGAVRHLVSHMRTSCLLWKIVPSDFSRAAVIQRGGKHLNRKFSA